MHDEKIIGETVLGNGARAWKYFTQIIVQVMMGRLELYFTSGIFCKPAVFFLINSFVVRISFSRME